VCHEFFRVGRRGPLLSPEEEAKATKTWADDVLAGCCEEFLADSGRATCMVGSTSVDNVGWSVHRRRVISNSGRQR